MNKLNKFSRAILAIAIMLCVALPTLAHDFEVGGIYYDYIDQTAKTVEVTCKGSYYYNYINEYTGSVTIPSSVRYSGTTYSVTSIGESAFRECSGLTSITIPNSVTEIGYEAFYECKGLTSITIPNSVTSIGESAFRECSGLTSITIPNSVTSIGSYAFSDCTSLTEVNISDLSAWCKVYFSGSDANPLYYANKLKLNGTEIKDLVIPNDITKIKDYAFYGCTGLTSVTIGNSVTSIGARAFQDCTGLTSINIPNSVTSIGSSVFFSCDGLTELYYNAENCTSMGSSSHPVFGDCSNLKIVNIGSSVKTIPSYAFFGCTGLTEVNISDLSAWCKIDFGHSGANPLYNANKLKLNGTEIKDLVIPNDITEIKNYAFHEFTGLTSVTIGNSVTSIGARAFQDCTGLTSVTIGNSVTEIDYEAFEGCSGLTSITIPNSVTTIGSSAFRECTGLTSVTIPNSVTSIGNYTFYNCTGLTSVTIPNSVTEIGYEAFYGCSGLTSVTIPNSVTEIGDYAFRGCSGLTSVTIGNSVTSIGDKAFWYCSGLTSITIPNSVTSIGDKAFEYCKGLTELIIEDGKETLSLGYSSYNSSDTGKGLFYDCPLEKLYIGRNLNYKSGQSYDYSPFYRKTKLKEITIGNSVTSIGNSAFYECSSLTSITIPNSVTSIGDDAFYGCSNLETVINLSNLIFSKGSSDYGYIAYYACRVINDPNVSMVEDFVFSKVDNVNILGAYLGNATELILPTDFNGENYIIGDYAFYGCTGLTSVTIGNSVTSIGNYTFYNCTGLTKLILDDGTESISGLSFPSSPIETLYLGRNTSDTFVKGKTTLKEVSIGNSVTTIGSSAFYGCTGLTSVTIPNSVTSIGSSAFYDCDRLTEVNISDLSAWCKIDFGSYGANPLYYAKKLKLNGTEIKDLVIPNDITEIKNYAFYRCTGLTSITIPNSVTEIGDWAFSGCTGLTELNYNAENCTSMGSSNYPVFGGCSNLKIVNIGSSVKTITDYAFSGCRGLTSVTIPNSVTSIGHSAFYDCYDLKYIVSLNTLPPVCASSSSFDENNYEGATLYVPKDSYAKYFIDDVWGQFTNINKIEILVSSITLNNSSIELDKDSTATITATIAPSNATIKNVVWTSSNPQIATVDQSGKVTAFTQGTATITAKSIDGSNVSASCKVTVNSPTITLSQIEATLPVNEIMTLSYSITNSATKTATWSTSNENVAYVKTNSDGSATIVGMADGVATITATMVDNGQEYSASCVVTVGIGGIEGVEMDNNAIEVSRYDIHGRLLSEPTPGINIVKMSNGTTRKEIVK